MRLKPIPEKVQLVLLSPILLIALPIGAIFFGALAISVWIEDKLSPGVEWENWFAWRPVQFNDWWQDETYNEWVWLENIQRRRENRHTEYRAALHPAESLSQPREPQ